MKIDPESLSWLETQLQRMQYGEVGIVYIVHAGEVVKIRRIVETKEQRLTPAEKVD